MNCGICERRIESVSEKYCVYHRHAENQLKQVYLDWKKAFGIDLTWESYLEQVSELQHTGKWAKEVSRSTLKSKRRSIRSN